MELEKEIELLKKKVKLLEDIKRLQEEINKYQQPYYVPYPVYPNPYPYNPWSPTITWTVYSDGDSNASGDTITDCNSQWSYT